MVTIQGMLMSIRLAYLVWLPLSIHGLPLLIRNSTEVLCSARAGPTCGMDSVQTVDSKKAINLIYINNIRHVTVAESSSVKSKSFKNPGRMNATDERAEARSIRFSESTIWEVRWMAPGPLQTSLDIEVYESSCMRHGV